MLTIPGYASRPSPERRRLETRHHDLAAYNSHARFSERRDEITQPFRSDLNVVVNDGDHLAGRKFQPFLDGWKVPRLAHPARPQCRFSRAQFLSLAKRIRRGRIALAPHNNNLAGPLLLAFAQRANAHSTKRNPSPASSE